jgi:hypothetical protein
MRRLFKDTELHATSMLNYETDLLPFGVSYLAAVLDVRRHA